MSRYRVPEYRDFRTGLTFATVRAMLKVGGTDRTKWRYLTRRCVLRFWRKLKLDMYDLAIGGSADEEPWPRGTHRRER